MVLRFLDDDEDGEYDLEFHGGPLVAAWLPLINFAVLIAAMRWHKFSFYAHVILALIVIGLTLGATLPVLINGGLEYEAESSLQKMHNYAGLIVIIWLGVQIVTGILARVIQYSAKVSTNICIYTKRIHHISSYLLMIAAKFNYLNIKFQQDEVEGSFFVLLIIDIIFLIFYLLIKFGYWTLSQEIIDNQLAVKEKGKEQNKAVEIFQSAIYGARNIYRQLKQESFLIPKRKKISTHYTSQSQIQLQNYVIFNDYIYDTDPFKELHPGGEKIILLVNKRQIDRFMYGYYGPQLQPGVKAYNHSQDSMRLCGQPVAKIDRVSPMKSFQSLNDCKIALRQPMNQGSDTYLLHLKPENVKLSFEGFKSQKQIGQYFTLTITNQKGRQRCTRLYTTIWCMRPDNVKFMEKNFPFAKLASINNTKQQYQMTQNFPQSYQRMTESEVVPFIIKKYKKGELTSHFCSSKFNGQIILSEPMGSGLKFDTISASGSVIFVCGGTGILPFCDFIDLLFKRAKVLESSNLTGMIVKNDPLVLQDFIKERSFIFYCANQIAADLPAVTIYQINSLCKSEKVKFSCVMRIRKGEDSIKNIYPNIRFQKDYFNQNIRRHIKEGNISQVYICGPPLMNSDVGKIMVQNEVGPHLYHFM